MRALSSDGASQAASPGRMRKSCLRRDRGFDSPTPFLTPVRDAEQSAHPFSCPVAGAAGVPNHPLRWAMWVMANENLLHPAPQIVRHSCDRPVVRSRRVSRRARRVPTRPTNRYRAHILTISRRSRCSLDASDSSVRLF
jgi:hypothetical protein